MHWDFIDPYTLEFNPGNRSRGSAVEDRVSPVLDTER